jgi:hypothetical protein
MNAKMNARYLLVCLFLLAVLVAGCSPAATATPAPAYSGGKSAAPAATSAPAATAAPGVGNAIPAQTERLVIKNASLDIVVERPDLAQQSIAEMAQQLGGFVVTSTTFKVANSAGQQVPQAKISIRVAAQSFNEALARIHSLVKNADTDISNENITGQDVTEDYVDLNSRLTNLQATEKQLQKIMENTTKTDDVLAVFRELSSTRQQIEVTLGKMKFYEQSASLSVIDVQIIALASIAPLQVAGWQPEGVARDAIQALIDTGKFLATAAIWLVLFLLPLGLVFFFPVLYIRKKYLQSIKPKAVTPNNLPLE